MISVVMPVYNGSKFVADAIQSILNQTYKDFELIIVDDGSTDSTLEIIEPYTRSDDRVKLIKTPHVGVNHARNTGVSQSQYPWIAVMDSDDIALPSRLEKQIKMTQTNPQVVAWGAYVHHINAEGNIISLNKLGPRNQEEFDSLRGEGHVVNLHHPTVLFRKDIFEKVGGYNFEFKAAHDLELLDRMAAYGLILAVPEPLVLYRVHSSSISMSKFFLQKEEIRYVVARHRARLNKRNENLGLEEFKHEYRNQSIPVRIHRYFMTMSQFYYRTAGVNYADKQYLNTLVFLILAVLYNPVHSLRRIWRQVFSSEARFSINNTKSL